MVKEITTIRVSKKVKKQFKKLKNWRETDEEALIRLIKKELDAPKGADALIEEDSYINAKKSLSNLRKRN